MTLSFLRNCVIVVGVRVARALTNGRTVAGNSFIPVMVFLLSTVLLGKRSARRPRYREDLVLFLSIRVASVLGITCNSALIRLIMLGVTDRN